MTNLRVLIPKKVNNPTIAAIVNFLPAKSGVQVNLVDSAGLPSIEYDFPSHISHKGQDVAGYTQVSRYLARSFSDCGLYGKDAAEASLVDHWLDFVDKHLQNPKFQELKVSLDEMNEYLKMKTFFCGYSVTMADVCVFGALRSSAIWLKVMKGADAPVNVVRWYQNMSTLPQIEQAMNAKAQQSSASKNQDQGSMDIDLPGAAEGNVVTRFPPEPSGYLHIGHAKAALLNEYFARTYKGRLIVRFDDTNPSKEKAEFEESIMEDLKMLNIHGDVITWTSDYFDKIYDLAIKLINMGKAYVDDTTQEVMRDERMKGIASKNRDVNVEENLKRFDEMKNATEFGLTCCLRAKMSVDANNKALRDPVIYRCNMIPHNRTKDKWKIYPTYDFACPIVDSLEGVTHALRTNEYHDRNDQYYWFIDTLEMKKPHIWDYSRVNFVYTLLSKRKLQWFVDKKLVTGWDDPRFPTVRGILRRGMTVEALKKYILMQGASKNNLMLEWDKLWTMNKQIIDPVAPRFCALNKEGMYKVLISDGPATAESKEMPKHKRNADLGNKETVFYKNVLLEEEDGKGLQAGEEVTFMDWGNVIVESVEGNTIKAKLHLEGDFKKTKKKLTWLSDTADLVPIKLYDFDYLITKKKLEENDSFEDCVNPRTEFSTEAVGDKNVSDLKNGDIIQFERKGFYILDGKDGEHLKFLSIPDGRAASIALKYQPPAKPAKPTKKK